MDYAYITLTTDFGLKDGFVGAMKGVLLSICPQANLADISHEVSPQNVLEGALVLSRAYSYFPAGTVHLAVVDPGVGTERRPVAARMGEHYFVGPDNGLFTPVLEAVEKNAGKVEFVHLTNPRYWLADVSQTFHGRDLFAPVAAYLAKGIPLAEFGEIISDPVRLNLPKPERTKHGWQAHITAIDHFGNLATDLPVANLYGVENLKIRLYGREIRNLIMTYAQKKSGDLVALVNSQKNIEIAVVNGSASDLLDAFVGGVVEVFFESKVE